MPAALKAVSDALAAGGVLLYLRHPATDKGGTDSPDDPRDKQRNLSAEGIQQAKDWGAAVTAQEWSVGEVLSSPSWRCQDAAKLAFGQYQVENGLIGILSTSRHGSEASRRDYSAALMRQTVPAGTVRVAVGHSSNISSATGESVGEGGGVVVRPGGSGFEVVGVLDADDWAQLG